MYVEAEILATWPKFRPQGQFYLTSLTFLNLLSTYFNVPDTPTKTQMFAYGQPLPQLARVGSLMSQRFLFSYERSVKDTNNPDRNPETR